MISAVLTLAAGLAWAEDREVVSVNGAPIRQSEVLDRLWRRYGVETLEQMIDELLLRQRAQARKIKPDPKEVERRVAGLRSQFPDQASFEAHLGQQGLTTETLGRELSDELIRERLVVAEKKLSVADKEVRAAFEARRSELGVREAVRLRHILVADEQQAKSVVERVRGGEDFQAVAREASLAPTGKINGGEYGFVSRGVLPPELEEAVFTMDVPGLTVVPTARGVHVLQGLERRKASPASFDDVQRDLREALLLEKFKRALPDYLRELRAKADIKPLGV